MKSFLKLSRVSILFVGAIYCSEYYVATFGSDSYVGTFTHPFRTIQQAANVMVSGDICYIRQGTYYETVNIENNNGSEGSPIIFTNYNNERVALDGTVKIDPVWQIYSGNIWKTTIDFDIWQLFLERDEMVMARWPNANFYDETIWDKENNWGHGTIDEDPEAYLNGTIIDEPHGDISLAESGLDITDAIAILNVGSYKTWTRKVLTHTGNMFTYDTVPEWKTKHHDYYLEGKLDFLDNENEWYFNSETGELYFYPPNGADPNQLEIRGKVQSYAFQITNSDYVTINNLEFFGTTFKFINSDNGLVQDCNFYYPSCYKRMLGIVDTAPDVSIFTASSYCTVSRSAFRYTDGSALEMYSGNNTIEDCYFYHIDYTATDLNGLMTTIQMGGAQNVFRRNTMHRLGASATLNPGNEALIELNDMSDSGHMQSDGALVQCMVGQQPGVEIRYNWLHNTIKYGARFDGNGNGNNGLMHHNVIWNVQGGIMVKGFEHSLYNNTAFDNGDKNDIIVMIEQGGNDGTITRNNAANKIAGHRSGSYQEYPVPGIYDHNWNGYETLEDVKDQLVDPENFDFRPRSDSDLIDAGIAVDGITGTFSGAAPDQGAYEYGGEMWVPGTTWDVTETFGDNYTPPEIMNSGPVWYVSNAGSDNNDGSFEDPLLTIQLAYERANPNDTVIVFPGIYHGENWFYGKNIVLASLYLSTGDTNYIHNTVIDGDSSNCNLVISGDIDSTSRISGFTIQNGIGCVYGQGAGIYIEGSSPRLDNLIIKDNHSSTNGGGVCINMGASPILENITIHNNSSGFGGGIYSSISSPTITNCTIKNNYALAGAGCAFDASNPVLEYVSITDNISSDQGGGIFCTSYSQSQFTNVTITNNSASNGGGLFSEESSYAVFTNSIFWNNHPEEILSHTDSLHISYSNIQGGWEGDQNIEQDPLFCLPENCNYFLAENSPCIGSGSNGYDIGSFGMGCDLIQLPPSNFLLITPENNTEIILTDENMSGMLEMVWERSMDENDDSLTYSISFLSDEIAIDTIETMDTSLQIPYLNFIDAFILSGTQETTLLWNINVTDHYDTVSSSNGPFELFISGNDILIVNNNTPERFHLYQNYPNPFNSTTTLRYDLPSELLVTGVIFNMAGKEVLKLDEKTQPGGTKLYKWDGKNNSGKQVPSGIYFFKVKAGKYIAITKMMHLK